MTTPNNDQNIVSAIRQSIEDNGERRVLNAIADIDKILIDSIPRIPASRFVAQYLDHILSPDEEESKYYRTLLAKEIGGVRRPFAIVDDEDASKTLFLLHGLSQPFNTNVIGSDLVGASVNETYNTLDNTKHNMLPGMKQAAYNDLIMLAAKVMKIEEGNHVFHLGWYEIIDFFGRLTPEEEKIYANIRTLRDEKHAYFFWAKPDGLTFKDYIDQNGRQTYGYIPTDIQQTEDQIKNRYDSPEQAPSPTNKPEASPAPPQTPKQVTPESTDDWE